MRTANDKATRQQGVTIVELMVTLAIAAILLGLALPAYNGFIAQRNLTAQGNDFVLALQLAKSEATLRGQLVSMQSTNAADGDNEWGPGWCVVIGTPGNCNAALRNFDARGANTIDGEGGIDGISTLTFNSRGLLTLGASGAALICDPTATRGRRVNISAIGRVSTDDGVNCP
jgi:prepilin-type N-terminal cleavage/methylation domain-containing protein